ncbi:alpha/beta hydrolase [Actinomadura sp. CNU-125]|nr:alpha/beta hydrolase [Actinomadura sp. CNU-125]
MGVRTLAEGEPGAPLVVFAHGLEDSWTSWRPLAAALDPRWRALALDLPWRPGNDYGWRGRPARHWLGLGLDLVGEPPAALVAHSFGASTALELMCARDRRVGAAAVLMCPLYRMPSQPVSRHAFERARAAFVQHVRDGVRAKMGDRADALDPEVLAAMMDRAVDRVGPLAFLAVFERFVESAALGLGDISLPALVLAGGADPTLSERAAAALAAAIPGADLHIDPDYDHFCHLRNAQRIGGLVGDLVGSAHAQDRTAGRPR